VTVIGPHIRRRGAQFFGFYRMRIGIPRRPGSGTVDETFSVWPHQRRCWRRVADGDGGLSDLIEFAAMQHSASEMGQQKTPALQKEDGGLRIVLHS
jgi:hypothetical protein